MELLKTAYRSWPLALTPRIAREYFRLFRRFRRSFYESECPWEDPCLAHIKQLVTHAYETVPLYRDKYDEAGVTPADVRSLADVSVLPYVTRAEMLEAFPYRSTSFWVSMERWIPKRTSGSTGLPLYFFRDHNSDVVDRATVRAFQDQLELPPFVRA